MKKARWKKRDTTRALLQGFSQRSKNLMPHKEVIRDITPEVLQEMLHLHGKGVPIARGLFICSVQCAVDGSPAANGSPAVDGQPAAPRYIAVDNTTGEMWTEEFDDSFAAERWLRRDER